MPALEAPVQHRWGEFDFLEIQTPHLESPIIRGAQAAEGGFQGAVACSGPRGSPGINDAYPQDANLTLVGKIYFP
jgi:hypothetical protein